MTLTLASVFAPLAFATGRTGRAVHRVRADAGRRGGGFRFHRADAHADDVLDPAQARDEDTRGSTTWSKAGSRRSRNGYRRALSRGRCATGCVVVGAWLVVLGSASRVLRLLKAELAPHGRPRRRVRAA